MDISMSFLSPIPAVSPVSRLVMLTLLLHFNVQAEIAFNIDALDVADRTKIDLSRFSNTDYVMPGDYILEVIINKNKLPLQTIHYFPAVDKKQSAQPCISAVVVDLMALKDDAKALVTYAAPNQCADLSSLPGIQLTSRVGNGTLTITIPQAWLKYQDDRWTPPEQWDKGVAGVMLDYNLSGQLNEAQQSHSRHFSSYGTLGANLDHWRMRADYQAQMHRGGDDSQQFSWNRIYVYRPLPMHAARLSLGERDLNSQLFDSFRFTGAELVSDERMLPPSLQGYAPEVSGIAKTNARVTVSQAGRIIYETTVPAGPFRLQDLDSSVRGKLDVRVEEQDGSVTLTQVDTATIPYLTRPGYVRYNMAAGLPADDDRQSHAVGGPAFLTGDFSWGVSNAWSVYGGALLAGHYNSWGLGLGRDLYSLGAISADLTQSIARFGPEVKMRRRSVGHSFKLNYAKQFDEYNSAITFAGYRFSQQTFMGMSQYLQTRRYHGFEAVVRDKELYTVTASKTFWADDPDKSLTAYLDYSHKTYWDGGGNDRLGVSLNKTFSIGPLNNISAYLSAYRSQYVDGLRDTTMALTFSLPIGDRQTVGYALQSGNKQVSHMMTYNNYVDPDNSYQVATGMQSNGHGVGRAYYNHNGSQSSLSLNATGVQSEYSSLGATLRGGVTTTEYGVALHQASRRGGARIMVDTDGIEDVSFDGGRANTNRAGIAVLADVSDYRRTGTRVDVDTLRDDIEAPRAVQEGTLTEGAIGYRKFDVLQGFKLLADITLADGSVPPFGASVTNVRSGEMSVIDEGGLVYLVGVKPAEAFDIAWNGLKQCRFYAPDSVVDLSRIQLTCNRLQKVVN